MPRFQQRPTSNTIDIHQTMLRVAVDALRALEEKKVKYPYLLFVCKSIKLNQIVAIYGRKVKKKIILHSQPLKLDQLDNLKDEIQHCIEEDRNVRGFI